MISNDNTFKISTYKTEKLITILKNGKITSLFYLVYIKIFIQLKKIQ